MDSQIVDAVTGWDTVAFGGGYGGLQALADDEFSGAVEAGSAWAFMLNGRVIGVVDGELSAFEDADGTAYEAPDPALPLLYTMQSGDSEQQAEYYSKDTPISEADETLSSGNFTGFIRLSENVLSGDYYLVYYGGRSMSVAFVGNSRRLLTGAEAFERADDEIGIYNVYAADIDVHDIPETEEKEEKTDAETGNGAGIAIGATDDGAAASAADDTDAADSAAADSDDVTDGDAEGNRDLTADPDADGDASAASGDTTAASEGRSAAAASRGVADTSTDTTAHNDTTASTGTESTSAESGGTADAASTDATSTATASTDTASTDTASSDTTSPDTSGAGRSGTETTGGAASGGSTAASSSEDPFSEESEWQNTTTIPSLDPSGETTSTQRGGGQQLTQQSGSISDTDRQPSRKQLTKRLREAEAVMEKAEKRHEELIEARDEARAERDAAIEERDAAIKERDAAIEERDAAQEQLAELEAKLEEAEAEIERLEAELQEATADAGEPTVATTAATDAESGHTLDPVSALEGTSLFVRYDSKGAATLDTAHDDGADPDELDENLRIDHHTTFETEGLTVDGEPFDAFIEDRIEVTFANWVVRDLLFDIQATGTQGGMRRIYDAIPKIDRIELRGTVDLGTDEDDEPIEIPYDCIVRDKHGNPLFVATFEESKAAVGAGVVEELIQDGSDIRAREEEFVAGFTVTTSYFEPGALEAAEDATSGGFLSRSRGKSFVSLSRKRGFHLCLVDRIEDGFDLRVPEL